MFTLTRLTAVFLLAAALCAGCETDDENDLDGLRRESDRIERELDQMRTSNPNVFDKSYEVTNEAHKLAKRLTQLDDAVESYLKTLDIAATDGKLDAGNLNDITKAQNELIDTMNKLELSLIATLEKIEGNATIVFKDGILIQIETMVLRESLLAQSSVLNGLRSLVVEHTKLYKKQFEKPAASSTTTITPSQVTPAPTVTVPQIRLDARETQAAQTRTGQGFSRLGSTTKTFRSATEMSTAVGGRWRSDTIQDAFAISGALNGTVMATDGDITDAVLDILGHLKSQLNSSSGDVEIVFVIDYSGSMSGEIAGVIAGLKKTTESLDVIKTAGRDVKVGVVLFGHPTTTLSPDNTVREPLDLTRSMVSVRVKLQEVLDAFSKSGGSHSTDPGEAWYHGIKKAAESMSWSAPNRVMITITDEPSYEIQHGMTQFITETQALLSQRGITNRIYSLVVPH